MAGFQLPADVVRLLKQLRSDLAATGRRVARLEAAPGFHMRLQADVAGAFPNNATTKVPMDTIVADPLGIVDLTNDWATLPRAGWWLFEGGAIQTAAMVVGATYQTTVAGLTGGWGTPVLGTWIPQGTARLVTRGVCVGYANEGDQVYAQFFHNAGAALTADGLVGDFNYLRGVWLTS